MLLASFLAHLLREAHLLRLEARLLQQSLAVPVHLVVALAFVINSTKDLLRREALEHRRDRDQPGPALVRYVQLHRQCSEEAAYQRLAAFVKKHVALDDQSMIENLLAHERQRLLALAQGLLVPDPDEIDEI